MTTIAYDYKSKKIAVDGRVTAGDVITYDVAVKYRYSDDKSEVWFFCGAVADEKDLMSLKHNDKPDVKPDCSALMVKDKKVFLVAFNGDYCSVNEIKYSYSIGSGQNFGLAALDFGASAKEAVNYAATRDVCTGGKVAVFDVEKMMFEMEVRNEVDKC